MKLLLIGAGNMGAALYERWRLEHDLSVLESNEAARGALKSRFNDIRFVSEAQAEIGSVVVLAVKPQSIDSVKIAGKPRAIVSIMAGVSLENLRERFSADLFVRAMPNLAAVYGKSATTLTGDDGFKREAMELFERIGTALWVESERDIAIATALAGSGPGFLALAAEAMGDAAVSLGMKSDDARKLTAALFNGMGDLLANEHPALLKQRVCSPAGTTIAGVASMEINGVRGGFFEAVRAAFNRSNELRTIK